MGLYVNIAKRLNHFDLQVEFNLEAGVAGLMEQAVAVKV